MCKRATDSPAAQVGDGGQVVENKRQRGHVYRQPLTFRTLQLDPQDPLKRAKVTTHNASNTVSIIQSQSDLCNVAISRKAFE